MLKKVRNCFMLLTIGALALVLIGCSTAGPFVTNISSDGQGNLIIEKNTVKFNSFTGNVSSGETPTTSTIRVVPNEGRTDERK